MSRRGGPAATIGAMDKSRVLVVIVVGALLVLGIFLLVGALLGDEAELEEQPTNGAPAAQTSTADVGWSTASTR